MVSGWREKLQRRPLPPSPALVCSPRPGGVSGWPQLWSTWPVGRPSTAFHGEQNPLFPPLLSLCFRFFSVSETYTGPACPFARAQAHHSYCFKKNFLALSLKLNRPLRVSYFVCSCLSCGSTTLAPSPLVGELRGVSVSPLSFFLRLQDACAPLEQRCPRYSLPQTPPPQRCQKRFSVNVKRCWLV